MVQSSVPTARDQSAPPELERDIYGNERRLGGAIAKRADADSLDFAGHAAVFNKPTLIGSRQWGFIEQIAPGAFKKTIREGDVRLLINHDPNLVLARTSAGTLRLAEDTIGLRAEADLAPTSYGRDLAVSLRRGDVSQMSFAFEVVKEEWDFNADPPVRTLREVKLPDVSVVTFPAYEETDAGMRALRALGIDAAALRAIATSRKAPQSNESSETRPDAERAGDEPLATTEGAEPATSHSTVGYERRYRALMARYGLEGPTNGNASGAGPDRGA